MGRFDRRKNLLEIKDVDELSEYLKELFDEISKTHPRYPEYGYTWDGEKIVEVFYEKCHRK